MNTPEIKQFVLKHTKNRHITCHARKRKIGLHGRRSRSLSQMPPRRQKWPEHVAVGGMSEAKAFRQIFKNTNGHMKTQFLPNFIANSSKCNNSNRPPANSSWATAAVGVFPLPPRPRELCIPR